MAGSKETPRQRMVGMMYLVLTALLALQVDNAVLEKFLFIDDSLQLAVNSGREDNSKMLLNIKTAVEKHGNKPADATVLKKASEVVAQTDVVMKEIVELRREIINISGDKDANGNYPNGHLYDEVMTLTLGPGDSKTGRAYQLKEILNQYSAKISSLDTTLRIKPIALDASQIEQFKNNEAQKNKDFAQLNFDHTPMVAALAILSQMQTEVVRVESKALERMASLIGIDEMRFDIIVPVVAAETEVVTAGTPYRAKVYVSAISSTARPAMSSSAGAIKVNERGEGSLEFIAQAGEYDATGRAKRVWKGSVTMKTPTGTDTTFSIQQEYYVAKPTIQVQAASIQALYLNCGNKLNIQVPQLGNNYDPAFVAEGGEVIADTKAGYVTIIPKSKQVSLTVKNKGSVIGTEKFRVKLIPKPTIQVFNGQRPLDIRNGGAAPRVLTARAIPDADFKEFLPLDARYRVTEWEVTLARGKKSINTIRATGESIDLGELAANARPGDRLVIEVKQVKRMNFRNVQEDVAIDAPIFSYQIQ